MARSHRAKEQRRTERIAQNHPNSTADRTYEYARIKKLEKRVLNKKEKHVIKMKDTTNGHLTKLNEKLMSCGKTTKITKKSKHVHSDDIDKVKSTDFGGDAPFFQSSRPTGSVEELLDDIFQILESLPSHDLASDCKNPKVSRIVQNVVRNSTEEGMRRLITILFSDQADSSRNNHTEQREGLCLTSDAIKDLLAQPYDKFLQMVAMAPLQDVPKGCEPFVDISADNYASFIVCTLIRRATHAIFKTMLSKYCIPYLPIILNHKPAIRIVHFLFINRFCGKKERKEIVLMLIVAALGTCRSEISKNQYTSCDRSLENMKIHDLSDLLGHEWRCWQQIPEERKQEATLHVHNAILYTAELFIGKLEKSICFPITLELLHYVFEMDDKKLPPLLLERRKELVSNVVAAVVNSVGQIFTSSVVMSQEWSERAFSVLSKLITCVSDDQFATLIPAFAAHIHRLMVFENKKGRYGSHRLLVALITRSSLTVDAFSSSGALWKKFVRSECYKSFRKACFEDGKQKRRKRAKGVEHETITGTPLVIENLSLVCQFSLCLVNNTLSMNTDTRKSFFAQYASFGPMKNEDQRHRVFLIVLVLSEAIHGWEMASSLKNSFLREGIQSTFKAFQSAREQAAHPSWIAYAERLLMKIGCKAE